MSKVDLRVTRWIHRAARVRARISFLSEQDFNDCTCLSEEIGELRTLKEHIGRMNSPPKPISAGGEALSSLINDLVVCDVR